MEQSLPAAEGRLGSSKSGGNGIIISAIAMACWGHFHLIVHPQDFACRVYLVVRPLQAWWHRALQLVSENVRVISYWIPRLIFEEQIGSSPGLGLTSLERSNNLEISQIFLEMEIGTNLWKRKKKMVAECINWMPV